MAVPGGRLHGDHLLVKADPRIDVPTMLLLCVVYLGVGLVIGWAIWR